MELVSSVRASYSFQLILSLLLDSMFKNKNEDPLLVFLSAWLYIQAFLYSPSNNIQCFYRITYFLIYTILSTLRIKIWASRLFVYRRHSSFVFIFCSLCCCCEISNQINFSFLNFVGKKSRTSPWKDNYK